MSSGDWQKEDALAVDHDFPSVFKVHCHLVVDIRLYLTKTPVCLLRVSHQHARFKERRHILSFRPV